MGMDDPEEDLYAKIGEAFNPYTERIARYGLTGAMGFSMKGSMQIGITDVPTSMKDLMGAPGSVMFDFAKGVSSLARGDISKGVEAILPTGVGNLAKAYRESTQGITSRTNTPLFYGNEPVKLSPMEAYLRALSFNPARIAMIREKQWNERVLTQKYTEIRTNTYAKLKRFWLSGNRDASEYAGILGEIDAYNEIAARRNYPLITQKSIRRNIKRAMRAPKRERERLVY